MRRATVYANHSQNIYVKVDHSTGSPVYMKTPFKFPRRGILDFNEDLKEKISRFVARAVYGRATTKHQVNKEKSELFYTGRVIYF